MSTIETYAEGFAAGKRGASLLIHSVKKEEDAHCEEASNTYKKYMLLDRPTLWEQGYMDGYNLILEENRKRNREEKK